MPTASPPHRTRLVGIYLTIVGGVFALFGFLFRLLLSALSALTGAGAGSSPSELDSFARQANWFCYPIVIAGIGLAAYGIYRIFRPVQIRQPE